jgi:hypothetical protein
LPLADQVTVNIVLNQRNTSLFKQGNQFLLARDGHAGTQWVLHGGRGQNGRGAVAANGVRQRFQQQAFTGSVGIANAFRPKSSSSRSVPK